MTTSPRVRFAPSPTGTLHVGNARTALFNYLYARRYGGTLVLRIEDTDQERSTAASEASILADLSWLGLNWDEGPDIGGDCGPFRQSERLPLYRQWTQVLLDAGHAYPCFCSAETLEALREQQQAAGQRPHYPGTCRGLTAEQVQQRQSRHEPFVLRFHIDAPSVTFVDRIRDEVSYDTETLGGDFVIVRRDGWPTYNFAVVVDDHLMGITDVIRGEDHLANTPKQLLIYRALGWHAPTFSHLSMILGPDRSKLSKRHGSTSVEEFRNAGYLPEAVFNYLALLGWNPGDDREVMAQDEIIRDFSHERLHKAAAVFDNDKIRWLCSRKIKALSVEQFVQIALQRLRSVGQLPGFWPDTVWADRLAFFQPKVETLDDLIQFWPIFTNHHINFEDPEIAAVAAMPSLRTLHSKLQTQLRLAWPVADFGALQSQWQKELGIKGKPLFQPIRLCLTGAAHGPDLGTIVPWIDRNLIQQRLDTVADYLNQSQP